MYELSPGVSKDPLFTNARTAVRLDRACDIGFAPCSDFDQCEQREHELFKEGDVFTVGWGCEDTKLGGQKVQLVNWLPALQKWEVVSLDYGKTDDNGTFSDYVYAKIQPNCLTRSVDHFSNQELARQMGFEQARMFAAELVIIQKFLNAPEGVLTDKPQEANLFVVPMLTSLVCKTNKPHCWDRCGGSRMATLSKRLKYYNSNTAAFHLFVAGETISSIPIDMQFQPMLASYGPRFCEMGRGGILIPPLVADVESSPGGVSDAIMRNSLSERDILIWTGDMNLLGAGRLLRSPVALAIAKLANFTDAAHSANRVGRKQSTNLMAHYMRRSVFCICMPGDTTMRIRFYHSFAMGCIPVVPGFQSGPPDPEDYPFHSWYRHNGPS